MRVRGGRTNLCDRITVGHVAPGLQTGFCADTGGGWGEVMVAHRSQLHPVPDDLPDERAVLVEPLACAVRRAGPGRSRGGVLVCGAGAVGLFAILALRELPRPAGSPSSPSTQRDLARAFGATESWCPTRRCAPSAGRPARPARRSRRQEFLLGGVDVAIDAVGSKASLDPVLRSTRAGGRVVLSGMPTSGRRPVAGVVPRARAGRHLRVRRGAEPNGGAFATALELAAKAPLDGVVGARTRCTGGVRRSTTPSPPAGSAPSRSVSM